MQNILTLETNKYAIKLDNFEGPLDLLCHLVDKNKMDINKVNISTIADQYIEYLNTMEKMNLDITSEFLIMASTLLFIKSKSLLPKDAEDETEITEEELVRRIIEYKKYKEICKTLKENFQTFSKRFYKQPDKIELPKRKLEKQYSKEEIYTRYKEIIERNEQKINQNAANIQKIGISDTYTVTSKVKQIFKELIKKPKFIFNKLFSIQKCPKEEIVTAFSGLLELARRNKIVATQEETFGEITVEKNRNDTELQNK